MGVPHSSGGISMGVEVVLKVWCPHFQLYFRQTHIFVVFLKVDQLLSQGLDFTLQVEAAQVGVVDNFPQTHDIGLHRLPDGQLRLIPEREGEGRWDIAERLVRKKVVQLLKFTHGDCLNTQNLS